MPKPTKYALLSVYDKTGIADFAKGLIKHKYKLIASGGTHKVLTEAGLSVINTADLVGDAILGHKVVTLSRELHAGLLADLNTELDELQKLKIPLIDLVCVDTYPLTEAISDSKASLTSVKQQTDIGGPAMLRSGAKGDRIVICEQADRQKVLDWLADGAPDREDFTNQLAAKAEAYVAAYCLESAKYRGDGKYAGWVGEQVQVCKYGENAYQKPAGLYRVANSDPLSLDKFEVIEGDAPSYNNWCDLDRLLQTMTHLAAAFSQQGKVPYLAIGVKHGNPCGAAFGDQPHQVIKKMINGDPRAIFGGLVMTNFTIDREEAELLRHEKTDSPRILDGIIAPDFSDESRQILQRKGGRCRFIANPALHNLNSDSLDLSPRFRKVRGGFLQQPNYNFILNPSDPNFQSTSKLTASQTTDLLLAWAICSTSNSNTITLVRDGQLLGNGVGQQDRVGACELAIKRATDSGHILSGSVACSDSFFPFTDAPATLIEAGISVIFATSGSIRDQEVQSFCEQKEVIFCSLPDSDARGFFGH